MNSLKIALAGACFLLGAAGAASAADVYQRGGLKDAPEAYYPAISWTGFYAGVHAGGAFGGEVDLVVEDENFFLFDLDDSFTGGAHVGYNWQASPHWVVGIEGSISFLSLGAEDIFGDEELSDYVASIRGRAGVTFDQNLVYGTVGVAFLGYSDLSADIVGDDTGVGFVIGAGWERKVSDNISFGIEGLYYDFEQDIADTPLKVEADFWTITARLNYHLTRGYDAPLK